MNQKRISNIILILIVIVIALAGAAGYFALRRQPAPVVEPKTFPKEAVEETVFEPNEDFSTKPRDVKRITDLRFTAEGLNNYFRDNKKFPRNLSELIEKEYINASYPINDFTYITSNDSKHYVLAIELELNKETIGSVNGKPLEKLEGTIYGIGCSDKNTFCLGESVKKPVTQEVIDEAANWKHFINTKNKYSFKYAPEMSITGNNFFGVSAEEDDWVSIIMKSGGESLFDVQLQKSGVFSGPFAFGIAPLISSDEIQILSLEEFAKKIWQIEKSDKNPYILNKKVSEIVKTAIANREAYSYSVSSGYKVEFEGGGILGKDHTFVFATAPNGDKFILRFLNFNRLSHLIFATFKFIK